MKFLNQINENSKIQIKGIKYDILRKFWDFDKMDYEKNTTTNNYHVLELHEFNNPAMEYTHILNIFENDNKIILFNIRPLDTSKKHKEVITEEDIEILS